MYMNHQIMAVSTLQNDKFQERSKNYQTSYFNPVLDTFKAEVARVLRDVEFCHEDKWWAWVYRKGDTHALGKIGFGDMQKGDPTTAKYGVNARHIVNRKFRDDSPYYYVLATGNMQLAVKNAAKYLVPFTACESMFSVRTMFSDKAGQEKQRMGKLADKAYEHAVKDNELGMYRAMESRLMKELRVLVANGYSFADPSLTEELTTFFTSVDAFKELEGIQSKPLYYVRITENFGQLIGQVVLVDWSKYRYFREQDTGTLLNTEAQQLPEFILGKIAVLGMVEPNTYVAGVGMRADERQFFVMGDE